MAVDEVAQDRWLASGQCGTQGQVKSVAGTKCHHDLLAIAWEVFSHAQAGEVLHGAFGVVKIIEKNEITEGAFKRQLGSGSITLSLKLPCN